MSPRCRLHLGLNHPTLNPSPGYDPANPGPIQYHTFFRASIMLPNMASESHQIKLDKLRLLSWMPNGRKGSLGWVADIMSFCIDISYLHEHELAKAYRSKRL
ncbi:hypothetical protein B0T13DRAFT_390760 [Neurospora crassa]|nr:hypothetical protein B0T13DRAFT_390760 [Neurospora crassa]